MDRASGSGVFARDPDAMLDMTELEPTEADVYKRQMKDLETAQKSAEDLQDESTAELEASIRDAEEINRKVRANLDKARAEDEARSYSDLSLIHI